jgi:tRNA A37 methylthiotransferase MiaB
MFGFPTETEEVRSKTVAFAKTLNPTYASFHKVTTYQGTPLFEMAKTHYNVPLQIEDHETDFLNQTIRQALLEFYVRWQYIYRNILISNPYNLSPKLRLFYNYWKSLKQ